MFKRYLEQAVLEDVAEKMVFIAGPRQVGKTTFAKQLGEQFFKERYSYLNWDNRQDRKDILGGHFKADKSLLIFDEIHKYKNWKNYLKGEYDKHQERFKILVTGSARLDLYRKGGDSLLGRYHCYRLHPFSLNELLNRIPEVEPFQELQFSDSAGQNQSLVNQLLHFGGFPEVWVKQEERTLRRWHNERTDRLIKEDIRDVENIRDLSAMQILVELLPGKVGSLFSLNSLREDLGVTHKTLVLWADILERFYYHFRIYPFRSQRFRALKKEPKMYLWDWSEVKDDGARFENMVASHLLKFCHFLFDAQGYKAELYYLRDIEKREVDFLVTVDNQPWFCVEVKSSYQRIPADLRYFGLRLKIPFIYQVVKEEGVDQIRDDIRVMSVGKFLTALV